MDYDSNRKTSFRTILVINSGQVEFDLHSSVLASFNRIYISILSMPKIIPWVQQHQPDLIILDLKWSEVVDSQLISALRLDWLTRKIPILLIADNTELQPLINLDYDARLNKSCSLRELEQTICSLISISAHEACDPAV